MKAINEYYVTQATAEGVTGYIANYTDGRTGRWMLTEHLREARVYISRPKAIVQLALARKQKKLFSFKGKLFTNLVICRVRSTVTIVESFLVKDMGS